MNRLLRGVLTAALTVPLMLSSPVVSAAEKSLSTDKTVYAEGEEIFVTAWGEGKDWVGIYAKGEVPGNPASIYWYYVAEDAEPGEAVSINKTRSNNRAEYASLPGGRYTVFLLLNDGYEIADSVDIVVLPAEKDRIRTAAMTFYEGDAPRVTAFGAGGEQVCLCRKDEDPKTASPLASYLLTEENSGKETALKPASGALTPGEYTVWLFPAEGPLSPDGPIASASFTVAASEKPDAPKDLNYRADGLSDGIASGTVTLTLAETGGRAEDVLLFWGKDGKPLEGYARLAKVHAAEGPMEIVLPENLFLPEGADEILARAENRFGASPFVSFALPVEAKPFETGEVLLRFQVTSDWHITENPNHDHNRHLGMMLDDIAAVCPDSAAVIAVGDIADHGGEKEYEQVSKIVEKHGAPPVHYVIGNHDVSMGKGYKKQIEIFNSFAGNDSAYYDLWIGGYHFIFLAFESEGAPLPIPKKELDWLEEKLGEDASPEKPIFVFCHESIVSTVAGSTPEEGWWGISNGDRVSAIFSEYPQTVFFNGHSHWELASQNEMFAGDGSRRFAAFNTSAVGYLWTGYNVVPGEYLYGSEGLFAEISENALTLRGRDFVNGEWIPSAFYRVPGEWETLPLSAPEDEKAETRAAEPDPAEIPAEAVSGSEPAEQAEKTGGCASRIGSGVSFVLPAIGAGAVLSRRKKKHGFPGSAAFPG